MKTAARFNCKESAAVSFRCAACGETREHTKPGRIPDYCSNACRQRAFYWRFVQEHRGLRYKNRE